MPVLLEQFITSHIQYFRWQDAIEVLFFTTIFYWLITWLHKDSEKKLLPYFFSYCILTLVSHMMALSSITYTLLIFSPVTIMLFILVHQDTLQRNMIALKHNTKEPITRTQKDWLSILLRSGLQAISHGKSIIILLEHTDMLRSYLTTEYQCESYLSEGFFSLILNSTSYSPQKMIWINSKGTLCGINTTWKASWHPETYTEPNAWIDDALIYTDKTDCLLLYLDAKNHRCTLTMQGKIYEKLTIDQAADHIKKHIEYNHYSIEKGFHYDTTNKTRTLEKHAP